MANTAKPRIIVFITCWVMAVLLCACGDKGRSGEVSGNVSKALAEIDSLMWRQPDSAFLRLQDIVFDKGFVLAAGTSFTARVIQVPDPEYSPLYIQNCHQPPQNAKP